MPRRSWLIANFLTLLALEALSHVSAVLGAIAFSRFRASTIGMPAFARLTARSPHPGGKVRGLMKRLLIQVDRAWRSLGTAKPRIRSGNESR